MDISTSSNSVGAQVHSEDTGWSKQSKMRCTANIWNLAYCKPNHLSYAGSVVNSNGILNGFVCEMCVWHTLFIPKHHLSYLDKLTFKGHIFLFIKLLTIFCAVYIPFVMVINSKNHKSKYPNTIWWIIQYNTIQYNKQFILCQISDKSVTQRCITSLRHLTYINLYFACFVNNYVFNLSLRLLEKELFFLMSI